jgi:transcriptional regulator with XRE-family HTH domain
MPRPNPIREIAGERTLARRIAYERKQQGMTPAGLAQRMTELGCPINQSAIWKIENSTPPRRITYDEAVAFAKVFGLTLDELAVPPEVAADKKLRALLAEHARIDDEIKKLKRRERELTEQVVALVDRFPDRFTQEVPSGEHQAT